MSKVTGVGGVFFESNGDSAALPAWYPKHLGMSRRQTASGSAQADLREDTRESILKRGARVTFEGDERSSAVKRQGIWQ